MAKGLGLGTLQFVVVDAMPLLFFHKDTENRISHVNKAVAELLGVLPEDMANTPSSRWFPDDSEASR
jgi:PAS domain-containing protein